MQKLGVSSISFLKSNRGRVVKISDDEFIYSPFPNTPRFLPGSGVCMRSIHAKNSSHDTERLQATHGDQLIQPPLRSLLSNILELRHDMNTRRTCKTVSCFPITNLARIKIVAERSRSIETRRVNNHTLQTLFLKLNFLPYPPPSPRLIQISKIHFMDFYGTPRTRKSRFYLSSAHRLLSMNQRKFFPNV